jgi:hypothetical protein
VEGEHGLQVWTITVDILKKQLQAADKGWFSTLETGNPITDLDRPLEFQEVKAPRFLDNWHMKVVRTGRLYPPGDIHGTHFC